MDNSAMNDRIVGYKPILALVVFLLTNVAVMFPSNIQVPYKLAGRRRHLKLSTTLIAPPLGVLLLLASRAIGGTTLRRGILGTDGIKPIDIMALFISLAYISISLDATGLIRFLAFFLLSKSKSGKRLYIYLYLLFFFAGVVVGNDPVILSGTAFLAYMTRVAGIVPPTAWIFAQFSAANIASAVLVSSNPTNLVLTGAFQISFTTYTANVILPSLASAILLLPYLLWTFGPSKTSPQSTRRSVGSSKPVDGSSHPSALIPIELYTNDLPPARTALVDKHGAIFGSVLLAVTLATLLATSAAAVNAQVWSITVPAALIMLLRDVWWDVWGRKTHEARKRRKSSSDEPRPENEVTSSVNNTSEPIELRRVENEGSVRVNVQTESQSQPPQSNTISRRPSFRSPFQLLARIPQTLPTCHLVMTRLPFFAVLFAFCMFILVQSLGSAWIAVFAKWWTAWAHKTGTVGAVFGMCVLTVAGCNFMGTNIGATILLARVLQQWRIDASPANRVVTAAIYALALGSNYGAFSATFSASLAGLLWRNILNQKGIQIRQREFMRRNVGINVVAMLSGCGVLLAQLYVKH